MGKLFGVVYQRRRYYCPWYGRCKPNDNVGQKLFWRQSKTQRGFAERIGVRTVRYTLLACGALDELYLRNISGNILNGYTEIHTIFGQTGGRSFINTQSKNYDYVSEEIAVPDAFSFTDLDKQIYLYNKTEGKEIKLSRKGQDPHGIMIPYNFKWSKEKVCIKDSYPEFGSWGQGLVESTDWYLKPIEELIINP